MGRKVPVPALVIDERQVTWTREPDAKPPMLRVQIEYEREFV